MKNLALWFFVSILFLYSSACSRPDASTPVVVHVFRDPSSNEVDVGIRALGQKRLMTRDNRPIVIATQESKTYQEGLATLGREAHPDVVVLDSADDAKLIERNSLRAVRTATSQYFIGVPQWSEGEQRNAAEQVILALRTTLEPAPKKTVQVDWHAELKRLQNELARKPNSGFLHSQAAVAYNALGDLPGFNREIHLAMHFEKHRAVYYYYAYAVYKQRHLKKLQIQALDRALQIDPHNPFGHYQRAGIFEDDNKWADALAELQITRTVLEWMAPNPIPVVTVSGPITIHTVTHTI
jgi:tetratricopeptide (TPR) repeat protein